MDGTVFIQPRAGSGPVCDPSAPNAPSCFDPAANPLPTDILSGMQETGPRRSPQSVKFTLAQVASVGGTGTFLPIAGGTLTGDLILDGDPSSALMAASKQYVDNAVLGTHVLFNDAPPIGVPPGTLWYDTKNTGLYVLYADGTSTQWVIVVSQEQQGLNDAPNNASTYGRHAGNWTTVLPLSGGTLTGALTLAADPAGPLQPVTLQYLQSHAGTGSVTSITAGVGLTGGTITSTGTIALGNTAVTPGNYTNCNLSIDQQGRITAAANGTGGGGGASLTVSDTPPTLTQGAMWFDATGTQLYIGFNDGSSIQWVAANNTPTGPITYAMLPVEVAQVPISFPFAGKPSTGAVVNVPMAMALTLPSGLAGTVVYDTTKATSNATFTVNRISGGTTTALGTVTITSTSNTSCTLAGSGGSLAAGDVLQVVAPTQDATLADLGITILASRV